MELTRRGEDIGIGLADFDMLDTLGTSPIPHPLSHSARTHEKSRNGNFWSGIIGEIESSCDETCADSTAFLRVESVGKGYYRTIEAG